MNVSKQLTGFLTITKYTIKKLLFSKRLLIVFLIMALMCGVAYYSVIEDAKKVDYYRSSSPVLFHADNCNDLRKYTHQR